MRIEHYYNHIRITARRNMGREIDLTTDGEAVL